jgi:hypothetical protein
MLKANILILDDLKQKLNLAEIKLDNSISANIINKLILKIRNKYREVITYYGNSSIITDDIKILEFIKESLDSKPLSIEQITINIYKKNNSLRRYIGEAISQQLRNNFENLIVSPFQNEWYFNAIDYSKKGKYENIDLFKGFRFKVEFLDTQIGLIVDPKSKFYTNRTLRDIYDENLDITNRYLEKMCPIKSCNQIFNPFALCDQGNPRNFNVMDVDNFFVYEKPSNAGVDLDLIKHYSDEGCCNGGILGKKMLDEKPFINHFFNHNKLPYSYPLELIRMVPQLSDAGEKSKDITQQTVLKPDERYSRLESSIKYFDSLKESSFPICLGEPIEINSPFLEHAKFSKPFYEYNSSETDQNPFTLIKKTPRFKPSTLNLTVIIPFKHEKVEILLDEFFSIMQKWYNCKINIEEILSENEIVNKTRKPMNFCLILKKLDSINVGVLTFLIENKIKFHSISLSTIINKNFFKRENIYGPLYHKNFLPFFNLEEKIKLDRIIGITVQYQGPYIFGAFLSYNNLGILEKGYFLKEKRPNKFNKKIHNLLEQKYVNNRTLVLFSGKITKELTLAIEGSKIECVEVSENSLIRLFRSTHEKISKVGVDEGSAIYFNNNWYIIPYNSTQGTQKSIKIHNVSIPEDKFKEVAATCFQLTKYHIGSADNSMKLPFPVHFGQKTIKLLREIKKSQVLEFKYPIYL